MRALQGHEGGVVVQPRCLLVPERVECGAIFRRCTAAEAIERLAQQRLLECAYLVVVDIRGRKRRGVSEGSGVEETISHQPWERDEQLITGEGGGGSVRGISQASRAKRKQLPERLPAASEPIDIAKRSFAKVSDPVRSWKRGRVTDYAALTVADPLHGFIQVSTRP